MPPPTPLPNSFTKRKALILAQLSIPPDQYDDLSPKGSIDEGIRELIDGINAKEGWVTTSSCAGRVSVFAEGERKKPVLRGWEEGEGRGEGNGGREEDGDGEQDGYEKRFEDEDTEGNEEEDEDEDSHVGGEEELVDAENGSKMKLAGAGGKGGGGRWLFVSHELVDIDGVKGKELSKFLGMQRTGEAMDAGRQFTEERLIHFKFEPMVRGFFSFFL
jgi:tRNA wybutosine-synthesizing protein 3